MRVFVLFALSALTLAACDSPYGPPPKYAGDDSMQTGSHLPRTANQASNAQSYGAGTIGQGAPNGGSVPGLGK
jgi:predicted small secreted protein